MQNQPASSRNLKDHFAALADPRTGPAQQHESLDILMIGVCANLCGAEGFTEPDGAFQSNKVGNLFLVDYAKTI